MTTNSGCGYGTFHGNGRGARNVTGDSSEPHNGRVESSTLVSANGSGYGHRGSVTGDGVGY